MNTVHYLCVTCDRVTSFEITLGQGLRINYGCHHDTFTEITRAEKKTRYVAERPNPWDRKTHNIFCKHGHPLSGDNVRIDKNTGYRVCKTCRKATYEKCQAKRKRLSLHPRVVV